MIRAFYSAGSGLTSSQAAMDNVANNLANVNTAGYKKQNAGFSELLYSGMDAGANALRVGNGVRATAGASNFSRGTLQITENKLDFALESDGFFAVLTKDGSVNYTRDGSFKVSVEDNGNYLVTANGDYVLDKNGAKIALGESDLREKIGVYGFPNPHGLASSGGNLFKATETSGSAASMEGKIRSGCLELSNVELTGEMSDLITIQRSFQVNAQMVKTADEIENIINNLR